MRILKPLDWQDVAAPELDVVVEGFDGRAAECLLWSREDFFTRPPHAWRALARAPVHPAGAPEHGLGHARLDGLRDWGDCVLGILPEGEATAAAVSGVRLGTEPERSWMHDRLGLPGEAVRRGLRFPLPVVGCALSSVPAEAAEPVRPVPDLPALLDAPADGRVALLQLLDGETVDAAAVLDDARALGRAGPRLRRLGEDGSYAACRPYLAAVTDALVLLPGGVVLPGGDRIWSDSTHAAFWLDPNFAQYRTLFRAAGGGIGLLPDAALTEADLLADNELDALPGVPLLAFGNAWRNHGHWLMNTVFAAFLLRDAVADGRACVLVPELSAYVLGSMRAAGIPRRALLVARPGTWRFARALFPSTLSIDANRHPPRAMAAMFRAVAAAAPRSGMPPGPALVYVTREGAGGQRRMENEAELVAALRARGFTVVAPHALPFDEEVRAFAGARVIVGQVGAGLLNAGFAPPGCRVVEIASHNYTSNDVWFLCAVLGHRFSRLLVEGPSDEAMTVTSFGFAVPLAAALALVDDVLGRL